MKSGGRSDDISCNEIGAMASSHMNMIRRYLYDGTPCAMKVACTVWTGGKDRDSIKFLPIGINNQQFRSQGVQHGWFYPNRIQ